MKVTDLADSIILRMRNPRVPQLVGDDCDAGGAPSLTELSGPDEFNIPVL